MYLQIILLSTFQFAPADEYLFIYLLYVLAWNFYFVDFYIFSLCLYFFLFMSIFSFQCLILFIIGFIGFTASSTVSVLSCSVSIHWSPLRNGVDYSASSLSSRKNCSWGRCPMRCLYPSSLDLAWLLALCGLWGDFTLPLPCVSFSSLVEFYCVSALCCSAPGSRSSGLWPRKVLFHISCPVFQLDVGGQLLYPLPHHGNKCRSTSIILSDIILTQTECYASYINN